MKKEIHEVEESQVKTGEEQQEAKVHPLQKSYMFVSTKHVDYNDLSAFEAISLSAVFVLAITVGVLSSITIA